jgi:hypothetical protein
LLEFARPGLLLAGAAAALVPLLLHLISRRPAEPVALPTFRFLHADPRTNLRVRRRPSDVLLLLLRMLLLLLLGAGFAGPVWFPRQQGVAELVLLDRSMRGVAWQQAVRQAEDLLIAPDGRLRGRLVVFDSVATIVPAVETDEALFDSLRQSIALPPSSDYGAALRAIRSGARDLAGTDSIRVTLLSDLRWAGWRPGMSPLRRAAWPGALHIPELPVTSDSASATARTEWQRAGRAVVLAPDSGGAYVRAALEASGWAVEVASPAMSPSADTAVTYLVLAPPTPSTAAALLERAGAGATVVVAADVPPPLRDALPWRASTREAGTAPRGGSMMLLPQLVLTGAVNRGPGTATGGAVVAVWEDGSPAAAAAPEGNGCLVFVAAALEAGTLPLSVSYPAMLEGMSRACEPGAEGTLSGGYGIPEEFLDRGARAVLRGEDLPPAVPARSVSARAEGIELGRWLLLGAVAIAIVETLLASRRPGPT